jgi:hypothetical protein
MQWPCPWLSLPDTEDSAVLGRRPFFRLPSVQALAMQCVSLLGVLSAMTAMDFFTGFKLPILAAALLQGACAAGFSRMLRLASWWLAIQFIFPLALLIGLTLHLPSVIYLLAFLFSLALFWTTFRSQVPFYPSGVIAWRAVGGLLPTSHPIRFVDIGSGFGGLVLYLARQRTDSKFVGIEVAPLPWIVSRLRARLGRSAATFRRGNYEQVDLGDFDVVFAYLSPAAMPALWSKACKEMRPGTLLLSYEFDIPGVQSHITNISTPNEPLLYGWNM